MSDRLERLLKIRRAAETSERVRWLEARRTSDAKAAEADAVAERRDRVAGEVRTFVSGPLNLRLLLAAGHHRDAIRSTLQSAEQALRASEARTEDRRGALESAHRQVRVIEKLAERKAADARDRVAKKERREADDRPMGSAEVRKC